MSRPTHYWHLCLFWTSLCNHWTPWFPYLYLRSLCLTLNNLTLLSLVLQHSCVHQNFQAPIILNFGHLILLYAKATRAITNHTPTEEYYLYFFSEEDLNCLYGFYPIKFRCHILYKYSVIRRVCGQTLARVRVSQTYISIIIISLQRT